MQLAIATKDKKIYPLIWVLTISASVVFLFVDYYIAFISLAALIVTFVIITKPHFGFYLLLLTLIEEQVRFFVVTPPFVITKFYLHLLFLYPTFISWVVARGAGMIKKREYNFVDIMVVIIVIYQTISIIWAPSFEISILTLIILYSNFLLYFMPGALVRDQDTLKNCVNLWIVTSIIVGIGIILTYNDFINVGNIAPISKDMGFQYTFKEHNDRASGFAGSDHAAGFIVLGASFVLGAMAMAREWEKKLMYLLIFFFLFYCNLLSATRATMIAQIALLFMFIFIDPFYRKNAIKYFFFIVIIILLIILIGKPGMIDRTIIGFGLADSPVFFEKDIVKEETLENVSGTGARIMWWLGALGIMIKNPILLFSGLGISGFAYHTTSPEVNGILWSFFYDMGLFGVIHLIIFLSFLFITFKPYLSRVSFKEMDYVSVMLVCAILGFIADSGIHGLVDYDLTGPGSRLVWFPFGFIMAILNILKNRLQEDKVINGALR